MRNLRILFAAVAVLVAGCTSVDKYTSTAEVTQTEREPAQQPLRDYDRLRGNPAEYDPGAPAGSKWIELYSTAPNYRQIGKQVLGGSGEKFRWEMGPMWYRGRLGKNQVKVFVVGQEGAQDENVSNRAFTGSTGTKTQNFLNHIGIYRSYLFMNTFVYTINGQLGDDPNFQFLEQGANIAQVRTLPPGIFHVSELSPIVRYRHKLFDNMLVENAGSAALFMGVGSGGKASLATWINARGGQCNVARDMAVCNAEGMKDFFKREYNVDIASKILVVGVPHPGGASAANGGSGALGNIIRGFKVAANRVADFKRANTNWLPFDVDDPQTESQRLATMSGEYNYRDAAIPYRDFAFGTNRMMGYKGTTSNRNGADSIQVFSDNGVYGDRSARYNESQLGRFNFEQSNIERAGFRKGVDMPWEPPRYNGPQSLATAYDAGPCGQYDNYRLFADRNYSRSPCDFASLLVSWPANNKGQSASFGPTSAYRGRPGAAEIIVVADQTSHDDFFTGRALSGEAGQKLQTWLAEQNVGNKYLILRTSGWDALKDDGSLDTSVLQASSAHAGRLLQAAIAMKKPRLIVGLGRHAQSIAQAIANQAGIQYQDVDLTSKALSAIPREDLPYHSRWWMGTSGNRAIRGNGGATTGTLDGAYHYYRVNAPDWNSRYPVPAISQEDRALLNIVKPQQ